MLYRPLLLSFKRRIINAVGTYKINLNEEKWSKILNKQAGVNRGTKCHLNTFEKNYFSQNGEDGVLEKIFSLIKVNNKFFVEFGASDGIHLSNTRNLKLNYNWDGLLLEMSYNQVLNGNKKGVENLFREKISPFNINKIFKKYSVPQNIGLLSIDIDSDNYWVWNKMGMYFPDLVIIETHPALPNDIPLVVEYGSSDPINGYFGANLRAYCKLASIKGYKFVTTVFFNAIFIKEEHFKSLNLPDLDLEQIIKNYFEVNNYWFEHRDISNRPWVEIT